MYSKLVIDSDILSEFIKIVKSDKDNQVKKEAIWVFGNALSCGSNEQIKYLCGLNILPILCKLVNSNDPEIVQISLDSIWCVLKYGYTVSNNEIASQITSEFEGKLLKHLKKKKYP